MLSVLFQLALVYVTFLLAGLYALQWILFPLQNTHFEQVWRWWGGTRGEQTRVLVYLPGNAEVPSADEPLLRKALAAGWDVVALGYCNNMEVNARVLARTANQYTEGYQEAALVSRSLGSLYAPIVVQTAEHDRWKHVVYMTPILSLRDTLNWHTFSVFSEAFPHTLPGWNYGLERHPPTHVADVYVVLAEHDGITPTASVERFVQLHRRHWHLLQVKGAGHNEVTAKRSFEQDVWPHLPFENPPLPTTKLAT